MQPESSRRGFTLIELLVVVLILGILVVVALPSYLSSIKDTRHKTANANVKAIATAVQSLYVSRGGVSYEDISPEAILIELGGAVPVNPCTGDISYDAQGSSTHFSIRAQAGEAGNCNEADLITVTLGSDSDSGDPPGLL